MYEIKQRNGNQFTSIYRTDTEAEHPALYNPKLKRELNQAGSLEFLVPGDPQNSFYDSVEMYVTKLTVFRDGTPIFSGRVANVTDSPITMQKQVTVAGALSYLNDSEVPPDSKTKGARNGRKMTAQAFLQWCIEQHNAWVGDGDFRRFTLGNITHSKKDEQKTYTLSGYTRTKEAIENNVIEDYGGYLMVRYSANGLTTYLDWVETPGALNSGTLEIANNIISQQNTRAGNDLFTHLRPVGKNGRTLPEETLELDPAMTAKYGKIGRSMSFSDENTEAKLRTKAQSFLNTLNKGVPGSAQIKMVDLHWLDGSNPMIDLGDRFSGIQGFSGEEMLAYSIENDLEAPQNDAMTLKNPKEAEHISSSSTGGSGSGISRATSSMGSASDFRYKHIRETVEDGIEYLILYADEIDLDAQEKIRLNAQRIEAIADEVSLQIGDLGAAYSTISIDVAGIKQTISDGEGRMAVFESTLDHMYGRLENAENEFSEFEVTIDGLYHTVQNQEGILSTLQNTTDGLTHSITDQQQRTSTLINDLNGLYHRVEDTEIGYSQLENTVNGLRHEVSDNADNWSILENTVLGLRNEVHDQEGRMSILENTAEGLKSTVQDAADRVSILENTAEGLKHSITDIYNVTSTFENTLEGMRHSISDTQGNMATLENTLEGMRSTVTDSSHKLSVLENTVDGMTSTVSTWDGRMSVLSNTIDGMSSTVSNVQGQMSVLSNTIDGMTSEVSNALGDISYLKNSATGLEHRVANNEGNIANLSLTAQGLQYSVEDAQGNISTLENTVNGLRSSVTNVDGRTSILENTVDGLNHEVYDEQSGLKTLLQTQAGRISMVVSDSGNIKAAQIAMAIDNAGSSVYIGADHIRLEGNTSINDVMLVSDNRLQIKKDTRLEGDLMLQTLTMRDGSTANTLAAADFGGMVKSATLSGNTLTLTFVDGRIDPINFSKATSLDTSSWSGETNSAPAQFVARVVQNGVQVNSTSGRLWRTIVDSGTVEANLSTHLVSQNFNVYADDTFDGESAGTLLMTKKLTIDATQIWNSVMVTSVGLADNYSDLGDTGTRSTIFIQGTASNGNKKDDQAFLLANTTYDNGTKSCVNLLQAVPGGTNRIIGRIDVTSGSTQTYEQGVADEAATVTVTQPTNNSGTLANTAVRDTISIKATATTTHNSTGATASRNFVLYATIYTNSGGDTGQHCVELRQGSSNGTTIGRLDVMSVYTAGETAGRSTEAGTITVTQPTNNSGTLNAKDVRTSISIKATGKTTNNQTGVTNSKSFTLERATYTNSGGDTGQRCVILKEGSTPIGRIDVMTDYSDGEVHGRTVEAGTLSVGQPTNNSGTLAATAVRTTVNIKATATTTNNSGVSNNRDFTLERATYTNSGGDTGQRCVILKQGSTAIGRIDVMTDYSDGEVHGRTVEAGTLSVGQPTNNSGTLAATVVRTTVNIKATATTTNNSGVSNNRDFTLERATYTNSGGDTGQRCVILKQGSTAIGRIDVMTDYSDGQANGRTTEAGTLAVTNPTNNSGTLGAKDTRTSIKIKATGKTTNSSTITKETTFTLERTTYTNSAGDTGQRCVVMKEGTTAIGRIDVMSDYTAGETKGLKDGRAGEANSLTVTNPTSSDDTLGDTATRTSIKIKATGKTTNSSTITKETTFTLARSTYTNSSGATGQRCVVIKEGTTVIGRISVMTDYNAGATTEAGTLSVGQPTNNSGTLGAKDVRDTINIKATASTTNSGTKSNNKDFVLARTTYTNSGGDTNQRCVVLKEGSTAIGRIDVMADYNAGWNAVVMNDPTWNTTDYDPETQNKCQATFSCSAKTDGTKRTKNTPILGMFSSWDSTNQKYVVTLRNGNSGGALHATLRITPSAAITAGATAEAESLAIGKPTNGSGTLDAKAVRDTINIKATATTTNGTATDSRDFTLARTTYTNSAGDTKQRCVVLKQGSTVIGRIDVMSDYNAGETAGIASGAAAEAASLAITAPANNSGTLAAKDVRTTINIKSTATTTNASKNGTRNFYLVKTTYTNSAGDKNQKCVELRQGSSTGTTIGRIDIM